MVHLFQHLAAIEPDYITTTTSTDSGVNVGAFAALYGVLVVLAIITIIATWKVFNKAGKPGWASIVPVYSTWVALEIGGQPGWWALVALIPFVGLISLIFIILATLETARRFGKGTLFGVVMILFPFIGYPILGFGKAQYNDPNSSANAGGNAGAPQPVAQSAPVPAASETTPPVDPAPPTNPAPPAAPTPPAAV